MCPPSPAGIRAHTPRMPASTKKSMPQGQSAPAASPVHLGPRPLLRNVEMSRTLTISHALILWFLPGLLLLAATAGNLCAAEKKVIGWVERVSLTGNAVMMDAKVDTGADFSSVHADGIRHFVRNEMRWVEFMLQDRNGERHFLQRPLVRMTQIKTKTQGHQERPVVMLEICVGDTKRLTQVNLAQRRHFKFPLLLGRDFLGAHYLVDPGSQYLLAPACH